MRAVHGLVAVYKDVMEQIHTNRGITMGSSATRKAPMLLFSAASWM